jgi:hypothetical protein
LVCLVLLGLPGTALVVVALDTEDDGVSARYLLVLDDEDVGAIEDATGEKVRPLDDCGILVFCDGIKGLPSLSR